MDAIITFFAARSTGFRIDGNTKAAWYARMYRQHRTGRMQPMNNLQLAARKPDWRTIMRPPEGMIVLDLDDQVSEDALYLVGDDLDEAGVPHFFIPSSIAVLPDEADLFPGRTQAVHNHLYVVPRTPAEREELQDDLACRFGWSAFRTEGIAVPGSAAKTLKRPTTYGVWYFDKDGEFRQRFWKWDSVLRDRMRKVVDLEKLQAFVRFLQEAAPYLPVVDEKVEVPKRRARRKVKLKVVEQAVPRPTELPRRLEEFLNEDVEPGFRSEHALKICVTAALCGYDVNDVERWTEQGYVGLSGYMLRHVGNGVLKEDREWGRRRLHEYDFPKALEIVKDIPEGQKARAVRAVVESGARAAYVAVYAQIAKCRGRIRVSHGTLAVKTGYSRAYVKQAIDHWVQRGHLARAGAKAEFGKTFAQEYELLIPEQNQQSEQTRDTALGSWAMVGAVADLNRLSVPLAWKIRLEGRPRTVMELLLDGRTVDEILDMMGEVQRYAAKRLTTQAALDLERRRRSYRKAFGSPPGELRRAA